MKKIAHLIVAAILVGIMFAVATGVWASPQFKSTTPKPPKTGDSTGPSNCNVSVDMGTAMAIPLGTDPAGCSIKVTAMDPTQYAPAPTGLAFIGDTFKVESDSENTLIKFCYAYPPEFADKNAKIYKLNEKVTPPVWVEIPGAAISNGAICVTTGKGVITLIGNP